LRHHPERSNILVRFRRSVAFTAPLHTVFDRRLLGQYLDGTTDVTRTLHFGTPTSEQRRAFTRVLQGHIAIDTAVFPNGTTGRSHVPDEVVKILTK
jgi:hypothetical protein